MQPVFDMTWRRNALQGEPAAVKLLLEQILQPLYGFCLYRVARNRHWCEEVVQETMLRALRDLANYDPPRARNNIFPWLTGLARNEIQRVLQREQATASLDALGANIDPELLGLYARFDSDPFDDLLLQREETRDLVNAALAQLPDHYRNVLEAKYIHGQSQRALAQAGQLSEKALESQLVRARKAFRTAFLALSTAISSQQSAVSS